MSVLHALICRDELFTTSRGNFVADFVVAARLGSPSRPRCARGHNKLPAPAPAENIISVEIFRKRVDGSTSDALLRESRPFGLEGRARDSGELCSKRSEYFEIFLTCTRDRNCCDV